MSEQAFDQEPDSSGSQPVALPSPTMGKLGRYQLVATLGRGGMGNILLALAEGLGDFRKPLVIKELRPELTEDDKFVKMFFNEVKLASRLSHPNIVHTLEAGQDEGRYFMAMEFLDGQPFSEVLQAATYDGRLTLGTRLMVLADALAGLHYAHELRDYDGTALHIVHSDMSPQNLFVTYDGQVKVVDFGIAKFANSIRPDTGNSFVGRFGYAAPELVRGQPLDRRTDIFAVGIMIWEAVTLRRFVRGAPTEAMVSARLNGTEPRLADVVPDVEPLLAAICDKAMHIDRHRRYASAAELRRALLQYLSISGATMDAQVLGRAMRDTFVVQHKAMHRLLATHVGDAPMNSPLDGMGSEPSEPARDETVGSISQPLVNPFDDITEVADLTDLVESSRGNRPLLASQTMSSHTLTDTPSPLVRQFTVNPDDSLPEWAAPPNHRKRAWVGLGAATIATALALWFWPTLQQDEQPVPAPVAESAPGALLPQQASALQPPAQPIAPARAPVHAMPDLRVNRQEEAGPGTPAAGQQRQQRQQRQLGQQGQQGQESQQAQASRLARNPMQRRATVNIAEEMLDGTEQGVNSATRISPTLNLSTSPQASRRRRLLTESSDAVPNLRDIAGRPTASAPTTAGPGPSASEGPAPRAGQDLRQLRTQTPRRSLDLEDPF